MAQFFAAAPAAAEGGAAASHARRCASARAGWLHEIKHNGYRMTVVVGNGSIRLWTRNGFDWTDRLPTVRQAVADLGLGTAAFDAELVCLDGAGRTDFARLQSCVSSNGTGGPLLYLLNWSTSLAGIFAGCR